MLTRERPRTSVRTLMPAPAHLPSLSDALARRAAIFGLFDGDEPPAPPRTGWQALGSVARRVADFLDPDPRRWPAS